MSERGTFSVDRGIWSHPAFAQEPFTEAQAFMWLVGEAAYAAHERRVGSASVALERGQTCHSVRFMAETWQWSKSRVDRFLQRLEKRDMLVRESGTEPLVVTICNYDKYQPSTSKSRDTKRDAKRDTTGTPAGQQRDKVEEGNKLDPSLRSGEIAGETKRKHDWPKDFREQFWSAYPRHTARKKAMEALERLWKADKTSFAVILTGCARLAEWMRDPRFVPHPATWLNGERWQDELPDHRHPDPRPPPGQRLSGPAVLMHEKLNARLSGAQHEPPRQPECRPFPSRSPRDAADNHDRTPPADEGGAPRRPAGEVRDFPPRRAFG